MMDFNYLLTDIFQVFATVALTVFAGAMSSRILKKLLERAKLSNKIYDDVILEALIGPTRGLIWLLGIAFAAHIIGTKTAAPIFDAVDSIRDIGIVAILTWFTIRFISSYEKRYIQSREEKSETVDRTLVSLIGKLLRASLIITSALVMLQTMGINIAGLLAFGGVGGIAVGMASRDMIANFFGGLTVYLDQPFKVGDWIRSPDKEIEGTVEDVGWRRTVIRTFDKRPLYVPNAVFTNISVENPSRMSHRRIFETIGVRYGDIAIIESILADIRLYLNNSDFIDSDETLMVNLNEFGPSSVDFFIYALTKTTVWTEYHEVKEKTLLDISNIIEKHGAEIAFPTTTVHVSNLPVDINKA